MKIMLTLKSLVMNSNGSMDIQIYDKATLIYSANMLPEGPLDINLMIDWPTTLTIIMSNKQPEDTVFLGDTVISNKAIQINQVLINNFPVQSSIQDSLFECQKIGSDVITNENFWGFNGTIKINLTEKDPMRFLLKLKNNFEFNRNTSV